jgi:hypothetical protein
LTPERVAFLFSHYFDSPIFTLMLHEWVKKELAILLMRDKRDFRDNKDEQ